MPKVLNVDYINYLEDKWKKHLQLKYDARDPEKRRIYQDVCDIIDEMKNETKVGKMVYNLLAHLHSRAEGEIKEYKAYLIKPK